MGWSKKQNESRNERRRTQGRTDRSAETANRKPRPSEKGRKRTPTEWLPLIRRRVRTKTSFMDDIAFTAAVAGKRKAEIELRKVEIANNKKLRSELRKVEIANDAKLRSATKRAEQLKADLRHHSVSIRRAHDEPRRDLALEQLAQFARQIESDLM